MFDESLSVSWRLNESEPLESSVVVAVPPATVPLLPSVRTFTPLRVELSEVESLLVSVDVTVSADA
jgi:hypothetical protein